MKAAQGMARLCDPVDLPQTRADACRIITRAMTGFPEMVAGIEEFDTKLMKIGKGKIVTKRGAEGYQIIGLLPGACGKDSPALGVAIKISDGDPKERARPLVSLEILRQLGAFGEEQLQQFPEFYTHAIRNWRKLEVGELRPCFQLKFHFREISRLLSMDIPLVSQNLLIQKSQAIFDRLLDRFGLTEWRIPLDAMDELISTVLSQNTNDRNRDIAFFALKNRFPTWDQVRDADLQTVIDLIRPAGLANQKGARIQVLLREITAERGNLDLSFLKTYRAEEAQSWLTKV